MTERADDRDPTTDAESYGDYSVDDEDQPMEGDSLVDDSAGSDVEDELDRGYNPKEGWSAAQGFGNTPYEEATGETLEQRVAQEVPEPDPLAEAEDAEEEADPLVGDLDENGEPIDPGRDDDPFELVGDATEVGDERAGRLVDPDQGLGPDTEKDLVGEDVGIDGAAASAEEAAVHVVDDTDPYDTDPYDNGIR